MTPQSALKPFSVVRRARRAIRRAAEDERARAAGRAESRGQGDPLLRLQGDSGHAVAAVRGGRPGSRHLVGTDSLTKRQKAINRFQQDADCRVFVGTTSAAGTGTNLTAANYVFFLGLPWTPGLQDQSEDRAYRNGQRRLVVLKTPLVENSIDLQL